ncbi:MAG: hypothetical protein F6K23_05340 [Okeania sp. SIO2C9]|uniref:hypothetical protein n=1 Tax=Okeania sp. SIO2C9 TaxID=2607791 RepID=UPI0013C0E138|nr:hypothetical protein [Okeania sp. SIO2C9]NEQ72543.1 hypothetical protein [Okeania sp. SIO2C9]
MWWRKYLLPLSVADVAIVISFCEASKFEVCDEQKYLLPLSVADVAIVISFCETPEFEVCGGENTYFPSLLRMSQ